MKHQIFKFFFRVLPYKLFNLIDSKRFPPYNGFIKTRDSIANKNIFLYLRKDSFMEAVIHKSGLYGDWEKESLKIWAYLSKKSDVIFDIGANTGIYSIIAKSNNKKSTVIAIEPIDLNYDVLNKNISKNNLKIFTEKVALSDKEGVANMYMLKDKLNYMTSVNDDRYAMHPEIKGNNEVVEVKVPIKPFSDVYEKYSLQKLDLIKIDVEGHEIPVIRNMIFFIEKFKPSILIEIIGDDNALIINELFSNLGYKFVSIDENFKSKVVEKLWDNDHHNFLLCTDEVITYLRQENLVL